MYKFVATLLTIGTLYTAATPAQANDTAIIQEGVSTTVVTGDGNVSTQVNRQSVRQTQNRRSQGNTGIVQVTDQTSDTYGHNNDTYMESEQTVEQNRRTRRR